MGLVAYGKSLAEAFANAAYGLFSLIVEPNKVKEKESRKVTVQAQDAEGLLFSWIN
ncbi:MAG: archease [Chloroflexi bacterium]|nr:archease [Chloroflexota bacterium]